MADLVYQLALDAEGGEVGDRVFEWIGNVPGLAGEVDVMWPVEVIELLISLTLRPGCDKKHCRGRLA